MKPRNAPIPAGGADDSQSRRTAGVREALSRSDVSPLERSVLSARVSKIIIEGLLDGRLRPGDRLVENDLADLLGVSRSPIREALTELAQSGIIIREPGRGGRIREWTKKDLEDLFGVRSELEGFAARLAAPRFDSKTRAGFDKIVGRMRKAAAKNDYLAMIELDIEFHQMLWSLTGNPLLRQVLEGLSQQFRLFLTMNWKFHGGLAQVAGNHTVLLDALQTGDPARAEEEMRRHVVVEKMVAALQAHEAEGARLATPV